MLARNPPRLRPLVLLILPAALAACASEQGDPTAPDRPTPGQPTAVRLRLDPASPLVPEGIAGVPFPSLRVRVTDREGRGAPAVVSWETTAGPVRVCAGPSDGCVAGGERLTKASDATGISQVWFHATAPGSFTVTASAPGLAGSPVTFAPRAVGFLIGAAPIFDCTGTDDPVAFFAADGTRNAVVPVGTTVEWRYAEWLHPSCRLRIVSTEAPGGVGFDSGDLGPGEPFRFVPDRPGLWRYRDSHSGGEATLQAVESGPPPPVGSRWQTVAPLPIGLAFAGAAAFDGSVYVAGGYTSSSQALSDAIFVWDPAADAWRVAGRLPRAVGAARMVALGASLYVVGDGWLQEYQPRTGVAREVDRLPTPRVHAAVAPAFGTLHVVGGYEPWDIMGDWPLSTHEQFDPFDRNWTPRSPLTWWGRDVVSVGERLFAVGGWQDGFEVYDHLRDAWTHLGTDAAPTWFPTAATIDGQVFIFGGQDRACCQPSGAVRRLNLASRTWQWVENMPTPRAGAAVATLGRSALVIGGYDAIGAKSRKVERFTP
ncbi:MAG TPA: hypothetical protein VF862_09275 [Gemmatimonadales bacterium]